MEAGLEAMRRVVLEAEQIDAKWREQLLHAGVRSHEVSYERLSSAPRPEAEAAFRAAVAFLGSPILNASQQRASSWLATNHNDDMVLRCHQMHTCAKRFLGWQQLREALHGTRTVAACNQLGEWDDQAIDGA